MILLSLLTIIANLIQPASLITSITNSEALSYITKLFVSMSQDHTLTHKI